METIFNNCAWTVSLGILFTDAIQRGDKCFAESIRYELGTAVATVSHLERCLRQED